MAEPQEMRAVGEHISVSSPSMYGVTGLQIPGIRGGSGPAESLFIDKVPMPALSPTKILIKVKAFGLNRMDISQRWGKYPVPPQGGFILGVEFAGIAVQLGEQTSNKFARGDEVFGLAYGGAYAEYVAVEEGTLIHMPKELSWEEAAGIPEVWMTATQAMYLVGDFSKGKSILWHAGASAVSIAGVQLSVVAGASSVYVTASSQNKLEFCTRTLGATAGIDYTTQDFAQEINRLTENKGVDIIIDFVGQTHLQKNLDCAAKDGTIVALASLSGTAVKDLNISAFVRKRVSIKGSSLRSRDEAYQARLTDLFMKNTLPLIISHKVQLFTQAVFPWEKICDAHKLMESNQTKGKIICTI
ncbi:hypothetical protein LTR98_011225 [Exophiala xenobiotica]|nr:hypothetical protein LTR98_011225 [Exophiala xenobiotica]